MGRIKRHCGVQIPAGIHRLLNELNSTAARERARQLILEEEWIMGQLGHTASLVKKQKRILAQVLYGAVDAMLGAVLLGYTMTYCIAR